MFNLQVFNLQMVDFRIFSTFRKYVVLLSITLVTACGGNPTIKPDDKAPASSAQPSAKPGAGGYYLDDGPGDNAPADIDNIPDAVLKTEVPLARANKPYSALGQQYTPMTSYTPYKKQGVASWYGKRYHGKKTSSGEIYDMYAMSGAHTLLPIPSYAKVTNPANGRSIIVRINDRGPFKNDRLIDLSYAAAYKLRLIGQGSGLVEVETIDTSAEAMLKIQNSKPAQSVSTAPTGKSAANPAVVAKTPAQTSVTAPAVSSTPAVGSAPVIMAADSSKYTYYVQVGAFKNEVNGELLQKRIQSLDLAESVGIANVYNDGLYRVKLGPYGNKKEADASAANIRKQLNIPAIVQNQ